MDLKEFGQVFELFSHLQNLGAANVCLVTAYKEGSVKFFFTFKATSIILIAAPKKIYSKEESHRPLIPFPISTKVSQSVSYNLHAALCPASVSFWCPPLTLKYAEVYRSGDVFLTSL